MIASEPRSNRFNWLIFAVTFAAASLFLNAPLQAKTYFIAPASAGSGVKGDGSRAAPWVSLKAAFASGRVAGGDELRLLAGDYGDVEISKIAFDSPVIILPATGAKVHLTKLFISRSHNLTFRDLQIWPVSPGKGPLVKADGRTSAITFQRLDVRSRVDADTYPGWSQDEWLSSRRGGIIIEGPDSAILDNHMTGVAFALGATGARARIEGNVVQGFSGDGARMLGDGSIFSRNRIEDCVQVDNNHADGFQSWSRGPKGDSGKGTVHGLTIEDNIIREWAGPVVSPLRCSLQGIGLFDGMYEDVFIRNNLVEVSAPHGITVAGGLRVRIEHNTVINNRAPHRKFPWIDLSAHKNGTPTIDSLIANNIATVIQYARRPEFRITATGNLAGIAPARIFVDPARGDFRPRPGGPAEGGGDPAYRLPTDLFGHPRDAKPDIGAIEFR